MTKSKEKDANESLREKMQTKIEEVLLKSVNELGKKMKEKLQFSNLEEAFENDNPIKFTKSYLEAVKEIKQIPRQLIDNMKKDIKDFNGLIKILSKQERKFKVLVFNFSKDEFKKSSSILFYTNFLNSFFIDRSREEFYERCSTILLSEQPMIDLLTNWQTYLSIASFIVNKKTRFETPIQFDQKGIPELIDEDFLKICKENKKLPDAIFYQLQFMFNMIDQSSDHKIIECFLSAQKKIKQIIKMEKIMKESYKILVEKIRVKNLSYILQKRNKQLQTGTQIDFNSSEEKNSSNNNDDTSFYKPTADQFKEDIKNDTLTISMEYDSVEDFWNQPKNNYSFENGILYDNSKFKKRKEESIEEWEYGIVSTLHKHLSKSKIITFQFEQQNQQQSEGKLYKLFCYNENENKWEKGVNDFSKFFEDKKKFISKGKLTPLIFFYNSKEEDLIAINSNFIKTKYPAIEEEEEEEIFIYGICDESMYDICKGLDNQESYKNIIPIILLLHVPKSKENLPNLKTIILQISTFISFISNINIIVLDKEHYEDQIDMLNEINNIKLSYNESIEHLSNHQHFVIPEKIDFLDDIKDDISDESKTPSDNNENINDINFDILSKLSENVFYKNSEHIILFNEPIFKYTNKTEYIILHNDFITKVIDQIIGNCPITHSCHFINVNDSTTYKGFIHIFSESVSHINTIPEPPEILQNLDCIQLANMTPLYLYLKSRVNVHEYEKIKKLQEIQKSINLVNDPKQLALENYKLNESKIKLALYKQLKQKVEELFMFIQYQKMNEADDEINQNKKEDDDDDDDDEEEEEDKEKDEEKDKKNYYRLAEFSILLEVQKEFYSTCPPLDRIFYYICTSVISDKMKELLTNKNIKKELNEKSTHNLKRLDIEYIRKNKDYISKEEINDMQLSHIQYLKDKFNDMIQILYPPNYRALAYEKNETILTKIINRDREMFNIFEESKSDETKDSTNKKSNKADKIYSNLKRSAKFGTNYHIRETEAENETELKLILEDGQKIDSVLDNDFI